MSMRRRILAMALLANPKRPGRCIKRIQAIRKRAMKKLMP